MERILRNTTKEQRRVIPSREADIEDDYLNALFSLACNNLCVRNVQFNVVSWF